VHEAHVAIPCTKITDVQSGDRWWGGAVEVHGQEAGPRSWKPLSAAAKRKCARGAWSPTKGG